MAFGTQEIILCLIPLGILAAILTSIFLAITRKSLGFTLIGFSGIGLIGLVAFTAAGAFFDPSFPCGIIVLTAAAGIILTIIEYTGKSSDVDVLVVHQPEVQHVVHTQTQPQVVYNVNVQNIQDSVVMQDGEEKS